MAIPLLALAIGAGAARTGIGMISADKQRKSNRNLIKAAYERKKDRTNVLQGDVRHGANESLNARGILNAGDGGAQLPTIRNAIAAGAGKTTGTEWERARMARDASRGGAQGAAGTLSAGTHAELSSEFYGEHEDLFEARREAINQNKADYLNNMLGSVSAGINTGTGVYGMGKQMSAMKGSKAPIPAGGAPAQPGPVSIRGAFGIDPVFPIGDPLRMSQPGALQNHQNVIRKWDR